MGEILNAFATVASIFLSLAAILLSYYTFKRTLKTEVRPILVFLRRDEAAWQLQNIGNGPAVKLVVADKIREDQLARWGIIANCYPLATGATISLPWIEGGFEFAATYTDIHGNTFTTHFRHGDNLIFEKNLFPKLQVNHEEWTLKFNVSNSEEGKLTEKDLEDKTPFELDLLRNEPYAKYGYIFKRQDLRENFEDKDWYKPTTTDQFQAFSQFSLIEKHNTQLILEYQARTGKTLAHNLYDIFHKSENKDSIQQ